MEKQLIHQMRCFKRSSVTQRLPLLLCHSFDILRRDLLTGVSNLLRPFAQINSFSNSALLQLLLYGDKDLSDDINKDILQLTLNFINNQLVGSLKIISGFDINAKSDSSSFFLKLLLSLFHIGCMAT